MGLQLDIETWCSKTRYIISNGMTCLMVTCDNAQHGLQRKKKRKINVKFGISTFHPKLRGAKL